MIKSFPMKIGNMRKPQNFVVYPGETDGKIKIQSDDCIATVDVNTGETKWARNKGGAYFLHLSLGGNIANGTEVIPMDIVNQLRNNMPKSGDKIGNGVYIG